MSSFSSPGFHPDTTLVDTPEKRGAGNDRQRAAAPSRVIRLLRWCVLSDVVALMVGLVIAWIVASSVNALAFHRFLDPFSRDSLLYLAKFGVIAAASLLWFQHTDHYRLCMPFWIEAKKIVSVMVFAALVDGFIQFASKYDISRLWLVSAWMVAALAMIALRTALRSYLRSTGRLRVRTLLVGAGATAEHTRAALASDACLSYEITGQVDDLPRAFLQAGRSWDRLCTMYQADYVIVALDGHELEMAAQPLAQLTRESVPFSVASPMHQMPVMGMVPHYFLNHDIMLLARSHGLEHSLPCLLKRTFDIVASSVALVLLLPLLLLLALWIRLDGGPALYAHTRLGRDKKPFGCLKFRSMVTNGDAVLARHLAEHPEARAEWDATQKLLDDPRVTSAGRFLRKTSLDELPQLINVLRGEMSLVGPRPIVNAEVAKYSDDIAHYYRVRPGVTGLWQVSGRSDVSYPQRVRMDGWYVRNWSLWHDIAILCKTFPALMNRSGAY